MARSCPFRLQVTRVQLYWRVIALPVSKVHDVAQPTDARSAQLDSQACDQKPSRRHFALKSFRSRHRRR